MSGGAAASRVTPQILADVTGCPVACIEQPSLSAFGAAVIARALVQPGVDLAALARRLAPASRTIAPGENRAAYGKVAGGVYRTIRKPQGEATVVGTKQMSGPHVVAGFLSFGVAGDSPRRGLVLQPRATPWGPSAYVLSPLSAQRANRSADERLGRWPGKHQHRILFPRALPWAGRTEGLRPSTETRQRSLGQQPLDGHPSPNP